MKITKLFLATTLFALLTVNTVVANAAECTVKSGKSRVALIELYTSEGCSSCPPADKWLSNLSQQGFDTKKVVPLSLHVDYWNYIGWKDPYSAAQYTQRQRKIAQRNKLRSIYTPQLVFNGRDYRGWRRQDIKQLLDEVNAWPAAAKLTLSLQSNSKNKLTAKINAVLEKSAGDDSVLFAALYENALVSNVRAGENDGRDLHHDYVVREMLSIPFSGRSEITKQVDFDIKAGWNRENLGVAIFVQQRSNGDVLQALSSPLQCDS